MNACERFRVLVSDLTAGVDLPEAERPCREHLAGCEDCESWAQSVLWQDRVLAELAGEARLDILLGRIRASIAGLTAEAAPTETPPPLRIRRPRPAWGRRVAAAAAVAALALGIWALRPAPEAPDVARQPEPETRVEPDLAKDAPPPEPEKTEVRAPVVNDEAPPPPPLPEKTTDVAKPELPPPPAPPQAPEPAKDKVAKARPPDKVAPLPPPIVDLAERSPDQAVKLGIAYLKGKCEGLENFKTHRDLRSTELVLWTMLHGGVSTADPDFQKLLKATVERKLEQTYTTALQAMLLEEIDRVAFQWRIQQCAQFLVDNQNRAGLWGYGAPSIFVEDIPTGAKVPATARREGEKPRVRVRVEVKKKRESAEGGDHSNSMYAALGLRACHDAGVRIPMAVVDLAQKAWREGQIKGEGAWCYGRHEGHKGYGSMTSGGVGSLVIYDYIQGRDWKKDRDVKEGLDWLASNFSVSYNPGLHEHARVENSGHHLYYYLYALERAAHLYGTELIGKKDWYAEGSKAILGAQRPDGSWHAKESGNEIYDTCFAVLFLRKATRGLVTSPDVPTGVRK